MRQTKDIHYVCQQNKDKSQIVFKCFQSNDVKLKEKTF